MSRRSRPSLAHQVDRALATLEAFGQSKHADKRTGQTRERIYSFNTRRGYTRDGARFAQWCQEHYGTLWLVQISAGMGAAYLSQLMEQGRSAWYLHRLAAALKKLAIGVQLTYGREVEYLPADLALPDRQLGNRRHGRHAYYQPGPLTEILAELEARAPVAAAVARAQVAVGLRISEAVRLRGGDILWGAGVLTIRIRGKGGRIRTVPVPRDFEDELLARARDAGDGRLYPTRSLPVQLAIISACRHAAVPCLGSHGFRHTFAVQTYLVERAAGADDEEARRTVRRLLGHGEHRVDIGNIYVPKELAQAAAYR